MVISIVELDICVLGSTSGCMSYSYIIRSDAKKILW